MLKSIIYNLYKNNGSLFLYIIFLMILVGLLQATSVVGIMPIVDFVLNENLDDATPITLFISNFISGINLPINVATLGLVYLVIVLVKSSILLYQEYVTANFLQGKMKEMIQNEYSAFLEASWSFFGTKEYGTLANTVVGETQKAIIAYEALAVMAASSIGLIFYVALALIISWKLTVIVLLALLVISSPVLYLDKYVYKIRQRHTKAYNHFQSIVYDTLNALKIIVGFSNRQKSIEKLRPTTEVIVDTGVKYVMVRVLIGLISEPLTIIAVIGSVTLGINYFGLSLGALFGFLYAVNRIVWQGQLVIAKRNEFSACLPSFEQIEALKNEALEKKEYSGQNKFFDFKSKITIEDLTFSYSDKELTIDKLSMNISKGEMIAIVGPSGSGKSTLVDLLMGFQNAESGKIIIDGQELKDLNLHDWRSLIGYIPQEPFLFNLSLRDNLKWAKENLTDEDIKNACDLANASEFISGLEDGFDTILGERGVNISGGQAQRLCLVRALVKKPQILILDEATSSLDSHSEKMIQNSIEYLSGKTTIISVAHRLSTIKKANTIYYMEKGRIRERGSFDELIAKDKGLFKESSALQGL
jgi:ABC-type multidrug transport system fused ATPase/permease subunit